MSKPRNTVPTVCKLAFCAAILIPLSLSVHAQDTGSSGTADERAAPAADDKAIPKSNSAEALLRRVATPELVKGISEGLKFLADEQDEATGAFGEASVRIATTSLAGMALLASGSQPGSGPYGRHIARAVDFILSRQDANSGYITYEDDGSRIHGHGYAITFLSQVLGHSPRDREIRRALEAGVRCLEKGQTKEGGWGYVPDDLTWDENSTTVCCLQALRTAQNAGVAVQRSVIQKAMGYLEKMAEPRTFRDSTGTPRKAFTFKYSLSSGRSDDSYALVAACVSCLNHLGVYSKDARWDEKRMGELLVGGMTWMRYRLDDFLDRFKSGASGLDTSFFYYTNFYAAQASWQYSDTETFEYYFPRIRDLLLQQRQAGGSHGWRHNSYGAAYATALSLLVLQIPYQYLPAFQR